jgi:hypothetical protein
LKLKMKLWRKKMSLNKDILLNAVLAGTGAKQIVKYNVNGDPCVFTRIPRFNLEDISPDLGTGPHPAFIVNGVIKNEILIGTYPAIFEKGCAISIPGQSPKVSITFDAAKSACGQNGPGYHLMTAWERGAIALWCLKNGFQPRGNTASGKSHEASWETGTPAPDNALKTLGGSGPAAWRHDGTLGGISDLVGNVNEWIDGLKTVDGRLYFPQDNNFTMPEAQWPASSLYLDATNSVAGDRNGAADSGDVVVSDRITKFSEPPTPSGGSDPGDFDYAFNTWTQTGVSTYFDALSLDKRQAAAQLMIAPKITSGGSVLFPETKGSIYSRNYGERLPCWGGYWGYGAVAGLGFLSLNSRRSSVILSFGLRPAFIL